MQRKSQKLIEGRQLTSRECWFDSGLLISNRCQTKKFIMSFTKLRNIGGRSCLNGKKPQACMFGVLNTFEITNRRCGIGSFIQRLEFIGGVQALVVHLKVFGLWEIVW